MCERANGNPVDTGFRDGAHRGERDAARCFELGAARRDAHRFAHGLEGHVVEQDQIRAGGDRLVDLGEGVTLDLDHATGPARAAPLDRGGEVGKRLDFLLQEMNRESNTVLSKTGDTRVEVICLTVIAVAYIVSRTFLKK